MSENTGTTYWRCEVCGTKGSVQYPKHAGVFEVVWQIDDAHRSLSPECPNGYRGIRVSLEPFEVNAAAGDETL